MKLRVFKADKGDALLLSSANGKNHVMIDGGMGDAYRTHCARTISKLDHLDVVYISHIDRDHVEGVHQMLDDAVAWKVHRFQKSHGNATHPAPDNPEPPPIKKFWQNNFHDQVGKNAGQIEDLLAFSSLVLSGHNDPRVQAYAAEQQELVQSVGDALQISWRIASDQLDIAVNPEFDHKLMWVADPADEFDVGSMRFTLIGPFFEDLAALRKEWNTWLEEHLAFKEQLKRRSERDFSPLVNESADGLMTALDTNAELWASLDPGARLAASDLVLAKVLGNRAKVTTPNLASLMFHVEENGRSLLLTGDGHCDDILDGLSNAALLRDDGTLHVNVLKVQHHGSEHNTSVDFCKAITADRYVFCCNGAHENPDLDVVAAFIDSRMGGPQAISKNPEAARNFEFVFNYHPDNETGAHQKHLQKVFDLVSARAKNSSQLKATFVKASSKLLTV